MSSDEQAFDDLRILVRIMRELGVVECVGVRLGPEPPKAVHIAPETPAERRQSRLEQAREEMRDRLAATGSYTDEQIDKYLPPELFDDA